MKALKVSLSLTLIFVLLFSLNGCLKYTSNILEVSNPNVQQTIPNTVETTFPQIMETLPQAEATTIPPVVETTLPQVVETLPQVESTTQPPVIETTTLAQPEPTTQAQVDPSAWTKAQIVAAYKDAVTKTKAYTNNISVRHVEGLTAEITKITGGSMIAGLANNIVSGFVKPVDETLNFTNGTAVNSEGETTQILLPNDKPCTLTEAGVASATATKSGDNIVIKITLVPETVGLSDVPVHNASAVGYLNIGDVDLGVVSIAGGSIAYKGSTIEATINADGYVTQCKYAVPLTLEGTGKAMGINAELALDGVQTEDWIINW